MQLVSAVIERHRLDQVLGALTKLSISNMLTFDVTVHGGATGPTEIYRAAVYAVDFVHRIKVEAIVSEDVIGRVLDILDIACARNGTVHDRPWVSELSLPQPCEALERVASKAA